MKTNAKNKPGQGRPPLDITRRMLSIRLPAELIDSIPGNKTQFIERAIEARINTTGDTKMKTQTTFNGLSGKQLLAMIPADNIGTVEINGENCILTPRKFEFTNRVVSCSNEDAEAVGVLDRFASKEILVKI